MEVDTLPVVAAAAAAVKTTSSVDAFGGSVSSDIWRRPEKDRARAGELVLSEQGPSKN